ncbi:MAG: hypothetical protein WBA74_18950 [Cyclobacteriaceae bacterium]
MTTLLSIDLRAVLLTVTLMVCLGFSSLAQSYEHSAGVRFGHTAGLTYKKFLVEEQALEVLVSGRNEGMQITLSYLKHNQMEFAFNENFYFFYGVGGHIGLERFDDLEKSIILNEEGEPAFIFEDKNYFTMGVNGHVGIEYRWLSIPMTISMDMKPYFNFIGMRYTRNKFWDAAFSLKYIF